MTLSADDICSSISRAMPRRRNSASCFRRLREEQNCRSQSFVRSSRKFRSEKATQDEIDVFHPLCFLSISQDRTNNHRACSAAKLQSTRDLRCGYYSNESSFIVSRSFIKLPATQRSRNDLWERRHVYGAMNRERCFVREEHQWDG